MGAGREGSEGRLIPLRLLILLAAAGALNPMNSTLIVPALVPLRNDIGASPSEVAWLLSALYLASAVGQPFWGRVADVFGPRGALLSGLLLLGLGGLTPAIHDSVLALVLARFLLGAGTSAMFPASMAILTNRAAETGQPISGRTLGAINAAPLIMLGAGPLVGGLLVTAFDWRWTFYVNIPVAVVIFLCVWLMAPRERAPNRHASTLRFDLPGALTFLGALLGLMLLLTDLPQISWAWFATAVAFGALFILIERRTEAPFLDVSFFARNKKLRSIYVWTALLFVPNYGVLLGVTQWMQDSRALSPTTVGFITTCLFAVSAAISLLINRTASLRSYMVTAIFATLVGSGILLLTTSSSPVLQLVVAFVVLGVAMPFVLFSAQGTVARYAPVQLSGVAAGLTRTSQYIGAVMASSVVAMAIETWPGDAGLHAIAVSFIIAVGLGLVLTMTTWRSFRSP